MASNLWDDKTKKIPQDASKISTTEPYEVEYWCKKLGCTKAELLKAVDKVGHSAEAVRKELKK